MKKICASLLLSALPLLPVSAQETSPDDASAPLQLCPIAPVHFASDKLMQARHIKVEARRAEIVQDQAALFSGNVDITSDTATIHAEQAQVNGNGREVLAQGAVTYQDQQLKVESDSVLISAEQKRLNMQNTRYQLTGFVGHGAANEIEINTEEGLFLRDVSFTTCPFGEEDWSMKASEISIEKGTVWGQAKNTRFYIGDVPVFYLPYFAFPISNQRQTGLLFPKITSSSSTGADYEQPFYWNMAPNYDMTIAPRFMINRGVQLKTEFRYLTDSSYGQINVEYLPGDRNVANEPNRYFYRYTHQGQLNDNWILGVDFNGMSDDNYIVDLGSEFYNRADTHLYRTLGVNYFSDYLDFSMHVRDFVVIGDHPDTYRALPEAKLNYHHPVGDWFRFKVNSELAYFDNTTSSLPKAMRWHLAPTLSLPLQSQWGEFTAEATVLNTYYRQENVEGTNLDEEVNRTLGQGRLFGALYFERDGFWLDDKATLTLEPKMQYLYTTFQDQTNIGFYDSAPLLTDVEGLFRGQEFTGLDRISDNNEITIGLTTRVIDEANREQFVLSLGQIFYLADNRVIAATKTQDRSALAAEVDWRVNNRWFVHSDVQITTDTDRVERSSVALEYRRDADSLVQLTHRYVRDLSGETIEQVGLSASWPINQNWHWVGRVYRDLELKRSIESYMGLQYESCCWAVRVVAQRHLSNRFDGSGLQSTNEYDSGISLQFIFKGIGTSKSNRAMLEDGMFGYRQPYSLN